MQGLESTPAGTPESIGRGRPRALYATLTLGHMAQGLAFTAFISALPQMAHDLGSQGELVAQMTVALAALGLLVGSLASGWVLEKAGTLQTLLASLALYGITGAGGMVLQDPTLLLISRSAVGFASACLVTTCLWGIAAEYRGDRRARALGIANSMGSLMSLAAMVGGGFIAQRAGWRATFGLYPVFALAGLLLGLSSMRQVKTAQPGSGARAAPFFLRLLPLFALATVIYVVMFMGSTQFAFLLQEDGIRDPATRSLIMSMVTVLATLTSFAYGWIQQRLGLRGAFLLGLVSATASLTAIGLGNSVASAIAGAALLGVFVGLGAPYVYHIVSERTDAYTRGRAMGMVSAFGFLGAFLNPVILAPLGRAVGIHGSFLVVAAVMAVFAAATVTGLPRRRATA